MLRTMPTVTIAGPGTGLRPKPTVNIAGSAMLPGEQAGSVGTLAYVPPTPLALASDVNKATHVKAKATTPKAKAKATGRNSQGKILTLTIKAVIGMSVCPAVWPQFASATNRLLSKTMLLC